MKVKSLSRVRLLATPWTEAYQAPPSMGFSRQEYWSGLPFSSPGDIPDPGIRPLAILWNSTFKWVNLLSFSPLPLASLLFLAIFLSAFLFFSQRFCASLFGEGSGNPLQYSCLKNQSHGWRSLVGCSPWGREELDTTEQFHFSLSCIGEGNGNPLQCSCLENSRDGGAWWAAIYEVAESDTTEAT